MSFVEFDPRAAERRSVLARPCEQPRTLAVALEAWLASHNRDLPSKAARLVIARRLRAS